MIDYVIFSILVLQCSSTCDGGYRMRTVVCYDMMASREVNQAHCSDPAPVGVEKCAIHPCAAWIPHNWTSCSVTCGMVLFVLFKERNFIDYLISGGIRPSGGMSILVE